ncbi:MAG: 16S rRNA (cytosine(1402)-N(4))-methyltransferase RsmH [Bryobacteraceae bacterium]|jgi:16S rRNA (cytosine1402-N4)-methyltransferase
MHYPVMLNESLEYLAVRPEGTYVDATAGLGGHTGAIARRLTTGRVLALDRDAESLEIAGRNTAEWAERIRYRQARFSELPQALAAWGIAKVDGLLADLGASRLQLTEPERGFSFAAKGPLDMRMDRSQSLTAADLVNTGSERELADLLYRYGEEGRWRHRIARAIVGARPIRDTLHLARVVEEAKPRLSRLHPATQTFMSLRRRVNLETEELDALLRVAPGLVASGGRIVTITFMSLEDRQVKEAFRRLAGEKRARILTKHVLRPGQEEIRANAASRSAKLRAVEIE